MNILLVDPDEYFHAKFKEKFLDLGNIRMYDKVEGLREVINDFQPNIIITELLISGGTVFELLEEFKPELENQHFSLIVYTKISNLEDLVATMEAGVSRYLVKGQDTLNDLKSVILNDFNYAR